MSLYSIFVRKHPYFSGTKHASEYPCPLGTFGNATGYNSSGQCSPCLGGQYCGTVGKTEPSGPCASGYFCKRFATLSAPNQTTDANICPQGKLPLTLTMLRVHSPKAQKRKNLWKTSKPCHVGTHWKALAEYSQMSTHLAGFRWFFRFFALFCFGRISHQQHKG